MTTTRIGYRIGATCDGDSHYWEVIETAAGSVAIEAHHENQGYPEVESIDLDASPDELRHIAAALVCIADAQELAMGEEAADG